MACHSPRADMVNVGTGTDERYLGPDELRAGFERDLAQSSARQVVITWFKSSGLGDMAWAAVALDISVTTEAGEMKAPCRATYVLERIDGRWLVVHSHLSLPWMEQQEDESFPGS